MIKTKRFIIRPFKKSDANQVYEVCNDFEISKTTLGIPFPYTLEDATNFIKYTNDAISNQKSYELAITLKENSDELVGCISLMGIKRPADKAELAYWVAKKFWNNGIATEAAKAITEYGFHTLKLNSIFVRFLDNNPASGKVMEKIGMKYVGKMREHEYKLGQYYDVFYYEILKSNLYK